MSPPPLVLASTSPYRRRLLERLGLPFTVAAPATDERPAPGESPAALVTRLAYRKAASLLRDHPRALIVGSDQVAAMDGAAAGKPGTHEATVAQLMRARGRVVAFHTGICLLDARSGRSRLDSVHFEVAFRDLTESQIESYVAREKPFDCAGGFKAEGLGIGLFERMSGSDPTALIGLPLLRLVEMLAAEGIDVFAPDAKGSRAARPRRGDGGPGLRGTGQ